MHPRLSVFLTLMLIGSSLQAEPAARKTLPKSAKPSAASNAPLEFLEDDLPLVLRTLARQAGINLVVSDEVTGKVSMRLDNMTPGEALKVIATSRELLLNEEKGIVYVRPKNPALPKAPEAEKSIDDAMLLTFGPAMTKVLDAMLDYQARPETAQKIAKGKKLLYDALLAEGFAKEEALRIVLSTQDMGLPDANK